MSKQPPARTYCKRNRSLPYYHQTCRTAPALEVCPGLSHHPTTPIKMSPKISSDCSCHHDLAVIYVLLYAKWTILFPKGFAFVNYIGGLVKIFRSIFISL